MMHQQKPENHIVVLFAVFLVWYRKLLNIPLVESRVNLIDLRYQYIIGDYILFGYWLLLFLIFQY